MSARLLCVAATALVLATMPAMAGTEAPARRTMTLTGTGEVTAEPDLAIVTLGVTRIGDTARSALSANTRAMTEVLDLLAKSGIAAKDMQTSGFSISPRYVYPKQRDDGTQDPPRIVGYTVANTLTIRVRQIAALGSLLDAVVSAGSNQVNGIAFAIAEPAPLRDEARRLATRDALAKAKLYASEAGVVLGPILSISEAGGYRPPPAPMMATRGADLAAEAVPVARGEQSIEMQVTIVWEIR